MSSSSNTSLLIATLVAAAALAAPVVAHADEAIAPPESSALAALARPAAVVSSPAASSATPTLARRTSGVSVALDFGNVGLGIQLGFRVHYVELTVAANSSFLVTSHDLGLRIVPFPGGLATPYLFGRVGTVEESTLYEEQIGKHSTVTGGLGGEVFLGASRGFLFAEFGLVEVIETETEKDSLNFTDPTKDDDRPAATSDSIAAVDFRLGLGVRF